MGGSTVILDSIGKVVRSKVVVVLVVATAWLWWRTATVGPPVWLGQLINMPTTAPTEEAVAVDHQYQTPPPDQPPSTISNEEYNTILRLDYPTLRLSLTGLTQESYNQFVRDVRNRLASHGDSRHGIGVLRQPGTVPDDERFLLVEITNMAEEPITWAIDVTTLYLVAYRVEDRSYFFRGAPEAATRHLFNGTLQRTFDFTGDYPQLLPIVGVGEVDLITLGFNQLDGAISRLVHNSDASGDQTELARSLVISIIMIAEAVRFPYIQGTLARTIHNGQYDTVNRNGGVASLIHAWQPLSEGIQRSNEDGVLPRQIRLQTRTYSEYMVTNVMPEIVSIIGIMLYFCAKPPPRPSFSLPSVAVDSFLRNNGETCADLEPTVRISGRDGLCVDVTGGHYNDGDPIILWPCKSNTDPNQLWTLKKDGTIRSKGKCLSSSFGRYDYISTVMIYDCNIATKSATRWKILDNGTIINSESSLVLTAELGTKGTPLTVRVNDYSTSQSWLPSNRSEPFVVSSILGFRDLCLQATGNTVWLEQCVTDKAEQKWALYPDRSIRPHSNRNLCLSCNTDESSSGLNTVNLLSCDLASRGQHWMFRSNGAILNIYTGMVMDVRGNDPSLHQIIVWPPYGTPNQKWLPIA